MTAISDSTLPQKPKWYAPATHLQWWLTWVYIIVGVIIMCSGFVFFINPYHIVPGGVYGAGIVLHSLFPSIQVGTFGWFFDVPLLTLSAIFLGAKIGSRTIFAAMMSPLVMNLLDWIAYPNAAAMKALDPTQLFGGVINMSEHLMLTTIIGAATIGLGCGLVVRQQATTGGTDIVAMFLQKYLNIRFSNGILICDAVVVLSGLLVFGLGLGHIDSGTSGPSWHLSFYSLIAIFVSSKTIAYVINFNDLAQSTNSSSWCLTNLTKISASLSCKRSIARPHASRVVDSTPTTTKKCSSWWYLTRRFPQ